MPSIVNCAASVVLYFFLNFFFWYTSKGFSYTYISFFIFFSIMVYHRILNIVLWVSSTLFIMIVICLKPDKSI